MHLKPQELRPNLVCKVRAHKKRPDNWNYEGDMDEYVDKHVIIIKSYYTTVHCDPLFKPRHGSNWSWDPDNFVKANTPQKIPSWVGSGR